MSADSANRGELLFLMRSPAYVRNFESVIRGLDARGHAVTVLFEEHKEGAERAGMELIERLCDDCDSLDYRFEKLRPAFRGGLRVGLRAVQDYLRYFEDFYSGATRLRSRALAPAPEGLERFAAAILRRLPRTRRALASMARGLETRLGVDRRIRRELAGSEPAAIVVTPLVQLRSRQPDWVRAAARAGIPSMLCVYSWDALTTKGLMHARPDRVVTWNEAQRQEAIELHGVDPDAVAAVGAWPYEHWLSQTAPLPRARLEQKAGIVPAEGLILYVCSSPFIAPDEHPAVARWLEALRAHPDDRLRQARVIVRPHPLAGAGWTDETPLPEGVTVFPEGGADPTDEESRKQYFDSLANADAVVGINTSALVEAAIADRPTFAYPPPDHAASQEDLPHFHLLEGMVVVTASMDEHLGRLAAALAGADQGAERRRRFVEAFARLRGPDSSPTDGLIEEIERLVGRDPQTRERGGIDGLGSS